MKPALTSLYPPIDQELLTFQRHVAPKILSNDEPIRSAAYLWSRFLQRKLPEFSITPSVYKPSTVAKFNDGFGVSGISLSSAMTGIRTFLRGNQK